MKISRNQKGFGAIEVIIILVVASLLGIGGWYVYSRNKDSSSKNTANTNKTVEEPKTETEPEDEVAQSWTLVTSKQGGFSIRIPDGWSVTNYGESNNVRSNKITYAAGQKAVIDTTETAYAGDSLVRFQVIQFKDGVNFEYLDGDEQKTSFSAGGVEGTRYYKVYPLEELMGVGPIPGEETYTYVFKTAGKTTYATYRILNKNQYSEAYLQDNYGQQESDPNQVELIDRVVKTLKIN